MKHIILLTLSALILTANQVNVKDVNKTKAKTTKIQELIKNHQRLKALKKLGKTVDKVADKLGLD